MPTQEEEEIHKRYLRMEELNDEFHRLVREHEDGDLVLRVDLHNSTYDAFYNRIFKKAKCPICNCDTYDDPVVGPACGFHLAF